MTRSTPTAPVLPTEHELRAIERVVAQALAEDLGPASRDLTEPATRGHTLAGILTTRSHGILSGMPALAAVCASRGVATFQAIKRDGDRVAAADMIGEVAGDAPAVLSAERVALNFLQRMSGIATLTSRFVEAVAGTGAEIYDTRKTTPGLRRIERYAVRCGGGRNHRFGLYDEAMVKDNHIDLVGIPAAVQAIREATPDVTVHVEVRSVDELQSAIEAGADVVLLDNMSIAQLAECVGIVEGRVVTEASGGITLETVREVAETGVDRISIGALTHSAPALDIALEVRRSTSS